MSWDIVLFSSKQKINSLEEIDESQLIPTDFCLAFEEQFEHITKNGNHREVKGKDFVIDYFIDNENVSNKIISLYGENSIYELVLLAKKRNWQIFDTGLGQMIDVNNPENNGFTNFQTYLRQILE